jgi:hypothetical protein
VRTETLIENFSRGIVRDLDRGSIPGNALWDCVDFLPDFDAPLMRRGVWSYFGNDPTGSSYYHALAYCPFSSGYQLVGVTDQGKVINVGTSTDKGGGLNFPFDKPKWFRDLLIVTGHVGQNTAPVKYDGATVAALATNGPTAVPNAHFSAIWKGQFVLAHTTANSNRAWFSKVNDPQYWNTNDPGGAWVDFLLPITGIAALNGCLLFFQEVQTSRIRGDNAPPGGDFSADDPVFHVGCTDARSIAVKDDIAIFANPRGVFTTDGSTPSDLTAICGASQYWQTLMAGYISPAQFPSAHWKIAGDVYRGHYIVSIHDDSNNPKDCLVFDLDRKTWFRFTNVPGWAFGPAYYGGSEELYLGIGPSIDTRVAALSGMWSPNNGAQDANSSQFPRGSFKTGIFQHRNGLQRIGKAYLTYALASAGSAATLRARTRTPSSGAVSLQEQQLPEAGSLSGIEPVYVRSRWSVNKKGLGFMFDFDQQSTAELLAIRKLEAELSYLEASRTT